MAAPNIFAGYAGAVWQAAYASMVYYLAQIDGNLTPAQTVSLTEALLDTLINGVQAINANATAGAWQAEAINLQAIQALPLIITSSDQAILNARTTAYQTAAAALAILIPQAPFGSPPSSIAMGIPAIPDMGFLEFYATFAYETSPGGTTAANLIATSASVGTAFTDIANAISVFQGANLTSLYDVATRQALMANITTQALNDLTSGPLASNDPVTTTWNQIVTVPALSMDASLISTAPFSYSAQQNGVIRNAMLTMATQLALFILILRSPSINQINLGTVMVGDSLLDIANRNLGNYEEWPAIAAANGLQPPWIGPTGSPTTGIAGWGQQLLMPTPGLSSSSTGTTPSYTNNFLGIDLYIGPINGDMPPWTGDFQTIAGYNNLAWAIGRRLQTTLGSLIYHPDYGSKIPPEVGAIQSLDTAAHITAYAKSAILSDPRVQSVPSASSSLQANGLIAFQGTIQPAGFGQVIGLNQVIEPLP